jgi:hypothetical protein
MKLHNCTRWQRNCTNVKLNKVAAGLGNEIAQQHKAAVK